MFLPDLPRGSGNEDVNRWPNGNAWGNSENYHGKFSWENEKNGKVLYNL